MESLMNVLCVCVSLSPFWKSKHTQTIQTISKHYNKKHLAFSVCMPRNNHENIGYET